MSEQVSNISGQRDRGFQSQNFNKKDEKEEHNKNKQRGDEFISEANTPEVSYANDQKLLSAALLRQAHKPVFPKNSRLKN